MTLSNPEIEGLLKDYDKRIDDIKGSMAKLVWYMRGGVSMTELLDTPINDYKYFNAVIEDNVELSKKHNQLIL